MAKRTLKPTKIHAQRFLYFNLAAAAGEDAHYIDLAKSLSEVNRRLYRQGMVYHVANISVHDSQGSARVLFSTAPNTWPTHASWQLGFDGWKTQRAQTLAAMGDNAKTPRWSDFKVYLNKEHVIDADWLRPIDDEENVLTQGEWDYADMSFSRNGSRFDNYAIGLLGTHQYTSITNETTDQDTSYDGYISCIEGLQEVRSRVRTESTYDVNFDSSPFSGMNMLHSQGIQDTLLNIEKEGDNAPYSLEFVGSDSNPTDDTGAYPVRECDIASTYSPMAVVGGFPVPCGLMQIETTSTNSNTIGILVELMPGDYKGVMAEPMGN